MSRLQTTSNSGLIDMGDLKIEEISSSNSLMFQSFKRGNTKKWYKNEENKNNANIGIL